MEGKADKILVFCPASLKNQWLGEVHKFTHLDGIVIGGSKEEREDAWKLAHSKEYKFIFFNYDLLLHDYEHVIEFCKKYEDRLVLVLDEAQKIKNWKAKRSKMMVGGTIKEGKETFKYPRLPGKYRWLLTGTPLENSPDELFNLFSFLDPEILGNYWVYRKRYIVLGRFNNPIGTKNLPELRARIAPYMLRRRVIDVEQQFPEVRHLRISLEMTPFQSAAHEIIRDDLYHLIRTIKQDEDRDAILGRFSLLMAVANAPALLSTSKSKLAGKIIKDLKPSKKAMDESPKITWIVDYMQSRMQANPNSKTVLFTRSERMKSLVASELGKFCKVYTLSGEMSSAEREEARKGFWKDGNAFISTDAGSTGLNLQCADVLINIDFPWNPAILKQRNGRIRRLGSEHSHVTIINLVSEKSIDERIEAVLYDKETLFNQLIENTDDDAETVVRISRNIMSKLVSKRSGRKSS